MGFTNLAGVLVDLPELDWPTAIADHFDRVLAARSQKVPDSRELAAPRLRVRMKGSAEVAGHLSELGMAVEIAAGLWNVVVCDFPQSTSFVSAAMVDAWGVDRQQVREVALSNTLAELPVDIGSDDSAGFTILIATGSFYAATSVNDLASLGVFTRGVGALPGVPTGDTILIHSIGDQQVVGYVAALSLITQAWFADAPGSASPELCWWRDGVLTRPTWSSMMMVGASTLPSSPRWSMGCRPGESRGRVPLRASPGPRAHAGQGGLSASALGGKAVDHRTIRRGRGARRCCPAQRGLGWDPMWT